MNNKILVAYFSCTNTTKEVGEALASDLSARIFQIKPVEEYTDFDLDYLNQESRTTKEKNDEGIRPEIKDEVIGMENYETVFLGFPVWWYKAPNIIYTFLESYDFSGKILIPFVTSGGSSIDSTLKTLRRDFPNINFKDGLRISSNNDLKNLEELI